MRPSLVKVGHLDFKVKYLPDKEWQKDEDLEDSAMGLTECTSARIWIRLFDNQNETVTREVLLHEILHAIFYVTSLSEIRPNKDWEETSIRAIAPTLLSVLRHNPKVSIYLSGV